MLLNQTASATRGNSLSTGVPFAHPAVAGQSDNWDLPEGKEAIPQDK